MTAVGLELSYLNDDQLQPGDILLKYGDGGALSGVISWGQTFIQRRSTKQGNTNIVHAGIMLDGEHIIESQGSGVSKNNLRTHNLPYDYEVYRCLFTNVAEMAASASSLVLAHHTASKTAKYGLSGAAASLFGGHANNDSGVVEAVLTKLANGKGHKFFCSQFVVLCFQYAAEQRGMAAQSMFSLKGSAYSPNKLKEELFKSQYFFKAGMLRTGIRR